MLEYPEKHFAGIPAFIALTDYQGLERKMNIVIGMLFVAVVIVVVMRLFAGLETPRSRHSREMSTALAALQTRSEFRADARKYR